MREKTQNLLKKRQRFIYDLELSKLKQVKPTFPPFRKKLKELLDAYLDLRKGFITVCIEPFKEGMTMFEALEKQLTNRNNQKKSLR